MELREMRAFIAVVEERGLSAAARRLHISQPWPRSGPITMPAVCCGSARRPNCRRTCCPRR
jgi:hypothetical protein